MRKKTKIIATISDLQCDIPFLQELFNQGMNVVRINTAHASFDGAKKIIQNTRAVSDKIAILIDTKGPEIRTNPTKDTLNIKTGDFIKLAGDKKGKTDINNIIYVNYNHFVNDIPEGCKILIDDGSLELKVTKKTEDYLECQALNDGVIQGNKSLNIPSVHIKLPALSPKDIEFIHFAVEQDIDFIAHSFVRRKEDIIAVQTILDSLESDINIIAKIENKEGVDNIEEILDYSYGVMVARGDLAVEISPEKSPIVQKEIVQKAIRKGKPVIIATQMLHSMITNPRPTRAEVNDIANAIYDRTDAIMLSGETAYGKYPKEAVAMMTRIAKEIEANLLSFRDIEIKKPSYIWKNPISNEITKSAIKVANNLEVSAIIADTSSGKTILSLAAFRGRNTIYAQCYNTKTMRKLALSYGVHVDYIEASSSHSDFIKNALQNLTHKETFKKNKLVLVVAGNFGRATGVSYMEVAKVKDLLSY